MKWFVLALAALAMGAQAHAAELRVAPGDSIVLNRANGRGYSDLVVQAAVVATGPAERATVHSLRVELMQGDVARETRVIDAASLVANTQGLAQAGFAEAIGAHVLNADGLAGLFGRPVTLAAAPALEPSTALAATSLYFAVNFAPDAVRVTAEIENARGRAESVSVTVPVRPHATPIVYRAPVSGVWMQQAAPTLQSHHRLNAPTEFAVDFFKMNEAGEIYGGDPTIAANAFGYGAPVLAAADGVVVSVVADETQDRAAMLRREGETPQQAGERIGRYMSERMARDFRRAAGGNLVVIRHTSGETTEYSSYGHLKAGSVRVRVGQEVRAGETIGEVGDTGDSAAVHLHFQINAGPDPFMSKSLPVRFANLRSAGGNTELGRFVVLD